MSKLHQERHIPTPAEIGMQQDLSAIQHQQDEEATIDLAELFYLYLDHIWGIILCLVIGAAAAFCITRFLITPMYTASSQIYVVSASDNSVVNLSDLQVGAQLTNDYQQLLKSHGLIDEVNSSLNLGMSYDQLSSMITISNPNNTRLIKISVENASPQRAADIANEIAQLSQEYLPEIMACDPPHITDAAMVPDKPSSPSYTRNIIAGAAALAILYCIILLIRMMVNDTLVTQEDVERYLGEAPIGVIPEGEMGDFNKKNRKQKKYRNRNK